MGKYLLATGLMCLAPFLWGAEAVAQSNPQTQYEALYQHCHERWAADEFSSIRGKVFFTQPSESVAYRFSKERVKDSERPAIRSMAVLLSECGERAGEILSQIFPGIVTLSAKATNEEIDQLIRFHDGALTWGELNSQRAELVERTRSSIMAMQQQRQDQFQRMAIEQNARWEQYIYAQQQESARRNQESLRQSQRNLEESARQPMPTLPQTQTTRCRTDRISRDVVCETR